MAEQDWLEVPVFKVDPEFDTTGALDVAILKGWDFKTCITFASAAAAMKCRRLGGRAGIPTSDEEMGFSGERGFRIAQLGY